MREIDKRLGDVLERQKGFILFICLTVHHFSIVYLGPRSDLFVNV